MCLQKALATAEAINSFKSCRVIWRTEMSVALRKRRKVRPGTDYVRPYGALLLDEVPEGREGTKSLEKLSILKKRTTQPKLPTRTRLWPPPWQRNVVSGKRRF